MYVCMCVCMYACMHACMHACLCVYVQYVSMYIYIYMIYIYALYVHYIHANGIHKPIYIYIYTYIYIYIYHTYIPYICFGFGVTTAATPKSSISVGIPIWDDPPSRCVRKTTSTKRQVLGN